MFNKLKRLINNSETMQSRQKNYQMARFVSLLIGIQGFIMFTLSMTSHDEKIAWISFAYGILMVFVFIYTTLSKELILFYISATSLAFILELSFILHGGTEGFGIIWILSLPLFTVYFLGLRFFLFINSIYLLLMIVGFWTPVHNYIYPFAESFRIRLPLVYILEFFFGTFLKYRIKKTEQDLQIQSNTLNAEIQQAALIQRSFFKQHVTEFMNWSLAYYNIPLAGVSGDLYDSYSEGGKLDGIGVFDISGHGISSGLITMLVKNIIYQEFYANTECPLSETANRINRRFIIEKGDIPNYFTGILARVKDNHIEFINAGHQYPILYKKSTNSFEQIKKVPGAMGAFGFKNAPTIFVSQNLEMESGDELILFTDGITDTKNSHNEKFGHERFIESIKKHLDESVDTQVNTILTELKAFQKDAPSIDDITVMILKKD